MHLNKRENATIIAALRHYQARTETTPYVDSLATDNGELDLTLQLGQVPNGSPPTTGCAA